MVIYSPCDWNEKLLVVYAHRLKYLNWYDIQEDINLIVSKLNTSIYVMLWFQHTLNILSTDLTSVHIKHGNRTHKMAKIDLPCRQNMPNLLQ